MRSIVENSQESVNERMGEGSFLMGTSAPLTLKVRKPTDIRTG